LHGSNAFCALQHFVAARRRELKTTPHQWFNKRFYKEAGQRNHRLD
jgi:hypothetical protein